MTSLTCPYITLAKKYLKKLLKKKLKFFFKFFFNFLGSGQYHPPTPHVEEKISGSSLRRQKTLLSQSDLYRTFRGNSNRNNYPQILKKVEKSPKTSILGA